MTYQLSQSSLSKLEGVHPDLVRVIKRAITITPVDFKVIEGPRTVERQRELLRRGASQTMNSRHIPATNGFGHAVDLVPYVDEDSDGDREISWQWPFYHPLAKAIKDAARIEGVPIEWGGDWKSFKDGPHWQLPWKQYPGTNPAVIADRPITNRTEKQVNETEAGAIAAGGVTSSAVVTGDGIGEIVNAVAGQQFELSSGDYVRMAIAGVILALTIYGVIRKLRS